MLALILIVLSFFSVQGKVKAGGWDVIEDMTNELVQAAAVKISEEFDSGSANPYSTSLLRVVHGTKQIVAGMNYELTVELSETNCIKPNREGCSPVSGGKVHTVKARVWSQPWKNFFQVTLLD